MLIGLGHEGAVSDRQTLFYSARRFVEALAAETPTVLVFEDIHVAAASLLDLLETLASRVRDVPLLLLTQARPELLSERPAWGGGLPTYSALQLEPLSGDDATELARQLFEAAGATAAVDGRARRHGRGESAVPRGARRLGCGRPRGAGRAADEHPRHRRGADRRAPCWRARGDCSTQLCSERSSGRARSRRTTPEALDALEGRDMIRRDPISRLGEHPQFAFKHQLIREVAYATLPRARRRQRHEAIARFLEDAVGDVGDVAPALAHHWREGGDPERAGRYFVAAGDQANRGWAKDEAVRLYQQALAVIPPEQRDLRREVTKRQVLATQAMIHLREMFVQRGAPLADADPAT